jgi:hypothetical protein
MPRALWISAGLLLAGSAVATETVLDSNSPYWEVGPRDPALSKACALGRFNQKQIGRYIVRLHAKKDDGAAVLGIAKGDGTNLRDLDHKANPAEDYFFRDDGTSSCEVFVGGRKGGSGGGAP